jgi:hypothetical protein
MQDLTRHITVVAAKHVCMAIQSAAKEEQDLKHGIDGACRSRAFEGSSVNATIVQLAKILAVTAEDVISPTSKCPEHISAGAMLCRRPGLRRASASPFANDCPDRYRGLGSAKPAFGTYRFN